MNIFDYWDDYEEVPGGATPYALGTRPGGVMDQTQPSPVAALPQRTPMDQGGLMMNHPQGGNIMGQGEGTGIESTRMPGSQNGGLDVSGFANYGMQAPELQGPMAQLGGLMAINQKANQPQQRQQMPQGGLMAYLMSLGAI